MNVRKVIIVLLLIFVTISTEASRKIKCIGPQLIEIIGDYEVIAGASNQGEFSYLVVG